MTNPDEVAAGRPVLLRGGTVLTMDDAHTILADADVLVTGDKIAAVGARLEAPDGALEIDASGGIVMPGMIDTHRHMWQTAMRAYGADWTLTQYFVWNYLEHGRKFRPQDIYAGNLVSAWESLEAGVTTSVDWSHNLHTPDHAEAAVDALRAAHADGTPVVVHAESAEEVATALARPEVSCVLVADEELLALDLAEPLGGVGNGLQFRLAVRVGHRLPRG